MLACDDPHFSVSVLQQFPDIVQQAILDTISDLAATVYYWVSFLIGDPRTPKEKNEDVLRLQSRLRRACDAVRKVLLTGDGARASEAKHARSALECAKRWLDFWNSRGLLWKDRRLCGNVILQVAGVLHNCQRAGAVYFSAYPAFISEIAELNGTEKATP